MESYPVPDEFIDTLFKEFAYDPIRLPVKEDAVQVLYDRTTLEKIWDTKHDAVNPYTRQPFNISNAIPQKELKQQMSQYILDNRSRTLTLDLDVIPDYTIVLSTIDMKNLLSELRFCYEDLDSHCSTAMAQEKTGNMQEEKYWKALWKKLNLLRLHCQYREENRETFSSIKGYEYLFMVIDEPLLNLYRHYYHLCDYAKEVCREAVKIVDIIDLKDSDVRTVPEKSLYAFVHILDDLVVSEYLKIQSMVLRIYRRLFYDFINSLIGRKIFCNCVLENTLSLLRRQKIADITNEDLYNGSATLKAGWIKDSSLLLETEHYVDVLVNLVIICISRLQNLHVAAIVHQYANSSSHNGTGHDGATDINIISMALDQGLSLIDSIVTDNSNESHSYADQKKRLQTLNIVKHIVPMVDLVLSGFKFIEPSHLRFGLNIARAIYKQGGFRVIERNDVEIFREFFRSDIVDEYGKRVKILLQSILSEAEEANLRRRGVRPS